MKNQEDSYHVLLNLYDCKHHKLDFHLFCFDHEGLFVVFDFPSSIFLKTLFHCEYHYGYGFKSISFVPHTMVSLLILVELQSFDYFRFQITDPNLNNCVCIDFDLVLCFLVGSSLFCFEIVANFGHSKDFCMNHHLSITLLSCLFCKIFVLILMILLRLLSFASYLDLFVATNALRKYACLNLLFTLLMTLLAGIALIYTMDVQGWFGYLVCVQNYVDELESRCRGMALDP